ncbi:hypothetical protein [Streptomyces sp. NPDC003832]
MSGDAATDERLAQFFEGEEPYTDPRLVPTPAQWIWKWNRATPSRRLQIAEAVLQAWDADQKCFLEDHHAAVDELREARITITRIQHLAGELAATTDGTETALRIRAALGREES